MLLRCLASAALVLCLALGLAAAGQDKNPIVAFIQAEALKTDGKTWKLRKHFTGWYTGSPIEDMLSGADTGQGEATWDVDAPAPGAYRLWVRYLDLRALRGPFKVRVVQNNATRGEKVFDEQGTRATEEGVKKYGPHWGVFVWGFVDATLEKGPARVIVSKHGPAVTRNATRHLDCLVLTQDLKYTPKESDLIAPLYLKVRMTGADMPPCALHIFGRNPRGPDWTLPHANITLKGLARGATFRGGANIPPGGESPWVNIAPLLDHRGDCRVQFTAITAYYKPLEAASYDLLLSSTPSDEGVFKTYHRAGPGAGIAVVIDLMKRGEIKSETEWSAAALAQAEALPPVAGKRPVKIPVLTGCAISSVENLESTVKTEQRILSLLGFNGTRGEASKDWEAAGFTFNSGRGPAAFALYKNGCMNTPDEPKIRQRCEAMAASMIEDGTDKTHLFCRLMDEPGSASLEHIESCPACHAAFRRYLEGLGLRPGFFGKKQWEDIAPSKDPADPRLYYYTVMFRGQTLANHFGLMTRILQEKIPDIRTTANYANEMSYSGNMLERGTDWFLIQGQGALTYGWTEDWLNCTATPQLCGFIADVLAAACRPRGQPYSVYNVFNRSPWLVAAKTAAEIGHGARVICYFNYGPYYAPTTDQSSHRYELYPAVRKANFAVGAAEDVIIAARPAKASVALLHSQTTDIWDLAAKARGVFTQERHYLWLILRHLGVPVDIVSEDEVIAGALKDYRALFVVGSHLKAATVAPLAQWAGDGGFLCLSAASALSDEFNAPLGLDAALGIQRGKAELAESAGRPWYEFPTRKVLDAATFGQHKIDVVCGAQKTPRWPNAEAQGALADGSPAAQTLRFKKGAVAAFSFFPGIAYAREGVTVLKAEKTSPNPFPPGPRELLRAVLPAGAVAPTATTSHPMAEACVLTGPQGTVVTLSNWTSAALKDLRVTLPPPVSKSKLTSVVSPIKSFAANPGGGATVTLDLEELDFLILKP
ncbi:MAG TPA: hypothetical protein P5137_11060 [Candidatus Brocadiia bacterium]|nr:hypothetical protein [Candidatus Brocadiia bacterium]